MERRRGVLKYGDGKAAQVCASVFSSLVEQAVDSGTPFTASVKPTGAVDLDEEADKVQKPSHSWLEDGLVALDAALQEERPPEAYGRAAAVLQGLEAAGLPRSTPYSECGPGTGKGKEGHWGSGQGSRTGGGLYRGDEMGGGIVDQGTGFGAGWSSGSAGESGDGGTGCGAGGSVDRGLRVGCGSGRGTASRGGLDRLRRTQKQRAKRSA